MPKGRMLNKKIKTIPIHIRIAVITRDNCTCQYCGKTGIFTYRHGKPCVLEGVKREQLIDGFYNGRDCIPFEIDHILPRFKGGENILNNLMLSCRKCNRSKGHA